MLHAVAIFRIQDTQEVAYRVLHNDTYSRGFQHFLVGIPPLVACPEAGSPLAGH